MPVSCDRGKHPVCHGNKVIRREHEASHHEGMKIFPVGIMTGVVWATAVAVLAQEKDNVMRPAAAPAATRFVAITAFDFDSLVPAPPQPGSIGAKADLETVLQVQAGRTP